MFNEYFKAEHSLRLLCADVNPVQIRPYFPIGEVADWRRFPLARTLTILLQSCSPIDANSLPTFRRRIGSDAWIWTANTISERDLVCVMSDFGEGERARRITKIIVAARPFSSAIALAQALGTAFELSNVVTEALLLETLRSIDRKRARTTSDRDGSSDG